MAEQVSDGQLAKGCIYPPLTDIRNVSRELGVKVIEHAYKTNLATVVPEPEDKLAMIDEQVYHPEYVSFIPETYDW